MPPQALIRVRLSARDARSETGQVDPTRLLELFNDVASELAIREVGDEGLLRTYTAFDVLGPLRAGDYIEARGRIVDTGRKSLTVEFVAHKVIRAARTVENPMGGTVVDPPRLLARATGVWLIPERAEVGGRDVEAAGDAEPGEGIAAGEEGAGEAQPLSWGGHRPSDVPREKRRPGSTVRMRPEEAEEERPRGRERDEEEERYWQDRSDYRRGGSRPYDNRQRDDRGRGGSRPYNDRPRDDRGRSGSRSSYSDRPRDDRGRSGSRPYNDRPRDDRGRGGSRPYNDRPRDDRGRSGSRSYSDRPREDRPREDRPREDRPREDRPPKKDHGDKD
ncbi:MAG: hypothetical protein U0822_21105 [Anaerolineae bacterium]